MKTNINIKNVLLMGITAAFLGMGCAWSQKLPSVTVGGAANKDAILFDNYSPWEKMITFQPKELKVK